MGNYVRYAFNQPKKYPSKPFLHAVDSEDKKNKPEMTSDEMEKVVKELNSQFGGKIGKT